MKIEAVCTIEARYVITDTGYTANMTLPEIENWARDHLLSVQVYLKEGGTEPKPVRAILSLKEVRFTPDETSK